MSAIDRVRRAFADPRVIVLAGWLVFLLYAYPGYLPTDAVDQLVDARVGQITDWHSATMTEIWRLVGCVVSGPFGMLALQSGLLLGGADRLFARVMPARAAAWAACGVLLFPPVMAPMAVVCRDSQLAAFLIAGAAALTSPRRAIRIAGLGLLLLACTMREGAEVAVIAVIGLGFAWREREAWWRRAAIALATAAVIVIAAGGLERALTDATTGRRDLELEAGDLVGVMRFAGPISDAELRGDLAGLSIVVTDELQRHGRALYERPGAILGGPDRLFDPPVTDGERAAMRDARDALVRAHPAAYLAHRRRIFYDLLGLAPRTRWMPVFTSFTETADEATPAHQLARHSIVQRALVFVVRVLGHTPLFRPYLYLALALALVPLAAIRRRRDALIVLGAAIANELSLFFVSTAGDYRLSTSLIVGTAIAAALLSARSPATAGRGSD